jgi:hypothetical protein
MAVSVQPVIPTGFAVRERTTVAPDKRFADEAGRLTHLDRLGLDRDVTPAPIGRR